MIDVRALSPDRWDWPYLKKHLGALPERFAVPVSDAYRTRYGREGQRAANTWLRVEVTPGLTGRAVSIAASDDEVCAAATQAAREVAGLLNDLTNGWEFALADTVRDKLDKVAARYGVTPLDRERVTLRGAVARMTAAAWWRRVLRRQVAREVERQAIALGMVHRRAGLYASDETVARRAQQQRRNAAALADTIATNEQGQEYTLAELAALGVANPEIRRAELMTRIRGFEDFAKAMGHVGLFLTWTCPSRMHSRLSASGQENPKWDGTSPRAAQKYLAGAWAKARAKLGRMGVALYGFRIAEPHHDGTPHWHMLVFCHPEAERAALDVIEGYATQADPEELASATARAARFKAIRIDWKRGSAAGYVAKYVAKNIDGKNAHGESIGDDYEGAEATEGAERVRAWASTWGIRQFQQIGGPGVTIWRELRRLKDVAQGELFPTWQAADAGNWHAYMEQMGGITTPRPERPVQLWREALTGKRNAWGEDAAPEVLGVEVGGVGYETRPHTWEIRRKPADSKGRRLPCGFQAGVAGPWTRVNNCTGGIRNGGKQARADGQGRPGRATRAPLQQGQRGGSLYPQAHGVGRGRGNPGPQPGTGG